MQEAVDDEKNRAISESFPNLCPHQYVLLLFTPIMMSQPFPPYKTRQPLPPTANKLFNRNPTISIRIQLVEHLVHDDLAFGFEGR